VPQQNTAITIDTGDHICLGGVPASRRAETCAAGSVYTTDMTSVRITGSLQLHDEHCPCDGAVVHLRVAGFIHIKAGGLVVGNSTHPLTRCHFRLSLLDLPVDAAGLVPLKLNPWGFRTLALEQGMLQLVGATRLPVMTRLAAPATAGSKTLTLPIEVTWAAGDRIAIAGTDRKNMYYEHKEKNGVNDVGEQAEEMLIASVSADRKTVTLTTALTHAHEGGAAQQLGNAQYYVGAEVVLLSRNIVVDGGLAAGATPSENRGWVLNAGCTPGIFNGCTEAFMMGEGKPGYVRIDGANFKDMGFAGATHSSIEFDGLRDNKDASESYLKHCAIERTLNTAIGIRHTTTQLKITDNVMYHVSGDGVRVDGTGNTIGGNTIVRLNMPAAGCEKLYFKFWQCRTAGFRIHSGNDVRGNTIASAPGAGFLTDGEPCTQGQLSWSNNVAHGTRDGLLVADHPAEDYYQWAAGSPTSCRRVGGVLAHAIGDQGLMVWYTKGNLEVENFQAVDATIGASAILMSGAMVSYHDTATAKYTNCAFAGTWSGAACRPATQFWDCKKSLLDSKPWCKLFHTGHGQQHMGSVGILETLFASTADGPGPTIGEHKFRWLEMDSNAAVSGTASHSGIHFANFDGNDACGNKNVAFHQNPYSNDTFHHHTFAKVTWSNINNGGEFWARRTYGDTHKMTDASTATWYLDYDNYKYGAYWPDAPNKVVVIDTDGSFSGLGTRSSIVASESITRPTQFKDLRYDGRGFAADKLPTPRTGCSWKAGWSAYACDSTFNWVTVAIENLAEDKMTRRPGPVVLCKGDGMIEVNGDPKCQGGVVDYASGPVMKGKTNRATLDRLSAYWFAAENKGNYTLAFRGQPPTWMRLHLQGHEHLGTDAGVVLNLRYFGLNSASRVGVYINGKRHRSTVKYGYPYEQQPAMLWPAPLDKAGTHYHDKFVDGQVQTATGQGIQRNVMSFVVRPGAAIDLRQEPIVQVSATVSMPIDAFFAQKETFVAAMASVLGIDADRIKFAKIVAGGAASAARRATGTTEITLEIDQTEEEAAANYAANAPAGKDVNTFAALLLKLQAVAANPSVLTGFTVSGMTASIVNVVIPRPDISVVRGTPYVKMNVTHSIGVNVTGIRASILNYLRASLSLPTTLLDDIGVSGVYHDTKTGKTRAIVVLQYEDQPTHSRNSLQRLSTGMVAALPEYTTTDVVFVNNGFSTGAGATLAPDTTSNAPGITGDETPVGGDTTDAAASGAPVLVIVLCVAAGVAVVSMVVGAVLIRRSQAKAVAEVDDAEHGIQFGVDDGTPMPMLMEDGRGGQATQHRAFFPAGFAGDEDVLAMLTATAAPDAPEDQNVAPHNNAPSGITFEDLDSSDADSVVVAASPRAIVVTLTSSDDDSDDDMMGAVLNAQRNGDTPSEQLRVQLAAALDDDDSS
jgi:hypothetical protein